MHFLNFSRFYLRRLFALQPLLAFAGLLALAALVSAGTAYQSQRNAVRLAQAERLTLQQRSPPAQRVPGVMELPTFHSVPLVQAIERTAAGSSAAVNEITFTFDDAATQPFLRYRARFSLVGRYFAIRDFIDQLGRTLPFAYLDSIHCTREDAGETDVVCEMTVTALYRRPDHV